MRRTRVSAAVAGAIVLAAVFAVPPAAPHAEPPVAAPLTPIPTASERLPIGSPFVAVSAAEVLRAAHSAPAAPAPASVTVPRTTTFVAAVPSGPQGIPVPALDAYKHAADMFARSDAACHLDWTLLAGIGRIESSHAYGGRVDENGNTRGKILGPRLDGSLPGTAVITDSDGGEMDDDPEFDRATGPMQFLPSTWKAYGVDGNDDGNADPNNIYDAAAGAARYLCLGQGDLREPEDVKRAILRYNPSESYVVSVLEWAEAYRNGTEAVPPRKDPVPVSAVQPVAQPAAPQSTPAPTEGLAAAAPPSDAETAAPETAAPETSAAAETAAPEKSAAPEATAPAATSLAAAPEATTETTTTPAAAPTTPSAAAADPARAAAPAASTTAPETTAPETTAPETTAPEASAAATPSTPATPSAAPEPQCPAEPVVLEPEVVRVLPDGSVLVRFAIPDGCTVTAATLQFTPGAGDLEQPVEVLGTTGEWTKDSTEAPETAEPTLTAAAPETAGERSVNVTALVAAGGTGLLLRTSAELTAPVRLTLTVG